MSVKVSSWVWHGDECADVVGNELVLLLALADVAGDEGRCRFLDDESDMTYTALARKVRVDRRTIIRLVAKLRQRGLVRQVPGQNGRPNEFTVVVPWAKGTGDKLSQVEESGPVTPEPEPVTPDARTGDKSRTRSSSIRTDVTTDVEGAQKRARRLPEPFIVTRAMREWAAAETPRVDVDAATRMFVDHFRGNGKPMKDWVATWRNWLRRDARGFGSSGARKPTTIEHGREVDRLLREQGGAPESKALAS